MVYNASNDFEAQQSIQRLNYLISNKKVFELIEKKPKRSYSQNNYQHLLFAWFALETGYTEKEVKEEIYKKIVNPEIFYEGDKTKNNITIQSWRSTSNLDKGETTTAINRFRNYASQEAGIYLPEPSDIAFLIEIERQISIKKEFL